MQRIIFLKSNVEGTQIRSVWNAMECKITLIGKMYPVVHEKK
jgi:hypothetical protein